ncbi:MAG: hypothetical protein HOO96_39705 [Polyangiaceae bacterium]|nr:hypothetical protein [Polyangiaceae bacterium]
MSLSKLNLLSVSVSLVLFGCVAEAPPEELSEEEAELQAFPDPSCQGPIAMSKLKYAALPASYEASSAAAKQKELWKQISETPYKNSCRPNSGLFLTAMTAPSSLATMPSTLNRSSDELLAGRRKMAHPFGTVATVEFVKDVAAPGSAAYSGILKPSTADKQETVLGVVRLSLAGDPKVLGFTPGLAVKFLVDGKPSLNVVTMPSVMGQKSDTNFFRHAASNEVPEPHTGLRPGIDFQDWIKADALTLGQHLAFMPAMKQGPLEPTPNFLHVDHLAVRTADGTLVPEGARKSPSHLVFRAPKATVEWWDLPQNRGFDYRDMLAALNVGSVLCDVYARQTPSAPEVHIGVLRLTSSFVASKWGDFRLFFRHNDFQNNADVAR